MLPSLKKSSKFKEIVIKLTKTDCDICQNDGNMPSLVLGKRQNFLVGRYSLDRFQAFLDRARSDTDKLVKLFVCLLKTGLRCL